MCLKIFVLYALGASAKIEALKKAMAEANNKAAVEQVLHEKHEASVIEAERELLEAVKKKRGLGAESSRERIRTRPRSTSRGGCSGRSPRCSKGHSLGTEGCGW